MVRESYFDRLLNGATLKKKKKEGPEALQPLASIGEVPPAVLSKRVAELDEFKRTQHTRRWRLYDVSVDGIRVFVEEKKSDPEQSNNTLVWVFVAASAFWASRLSGFFGIVWIALAAPIAWVLCCPENPQRHPEDVAAKRPWRATGRVRATCSIEARPDDVFRLVRGQSPTTRAESEWSVDYEDGRLVEAVDRHTDVVEVVEQVKAWRPVADILDGKCGMLRKILAWHKRSSRLMRYWRRDDAGGYTLVTQSVEGNPSFHAYQDGGCTVVAQDVRGSVVEIRPAGVGDGVVVTEAADVDAKLSWLSALYGFGDPPRAVRVATHSIVAVAWHASRLRNRMRGLRACAVQLCHQDGDPGKSLSSLCVAASGLYRADELSPRHHHHHRVKQPTPVSARPSNASSEAPHATVPPHVSEPDPTVTGAHLFGFLSPAFRKATVLFEPNSWEEPTHEQFHVRGLHYLEDNRKVQAAPATCRLLAVGVLKSEATLNNIISLPQHDVEGPLATGIVVNFILPHDGKYNTAFMFYFADLKKDPAFSRRLKAFAFDWTDAQRDDHFKLIPVVSEGPWVVRHALGSKPAIIGRGIHTTYHVRGTPDDGFVVEIDVDVGTSAVANGVWRIMKGVAKTLVCDLGFLLESKLQADLPESLFGVSRISHFDFAKHDNPAVTLIKPPTKQGSPNKRPVSMPVPAATPPVANTTSSSGGAHGHHQQRRTAAPTSRV